MNVFGIALHRPENLEIQAVVMKMIGLVIVCAMLVQLKVIDGRVAVMVMGGAIGAASAWLVGFRQGCGKRAVLVQAAAAAFGALGAELLWSLL